MKKRDVKKVFSEVSAQNEADGVTGGLNRARSITVGTAFGGTTELMMRKNDGTVVWALLQPVEAIELIHQIAANVGCHIHIQPRKDFASWREWRTSPEEKLSLNGHPPFSSSKAPYMQVGANLPPPEQQPGFQHALTAKETQNEQPVAIEKTIKRRSTKRTATTA